MITEEMIKEAYPNYRPYVPGKVYKHGEEPHYFTEFAYHYNRNKEPFEPCWNVSDKETRVHLQLVLEGLAKDRWENI